MKLRFTLSLVILFAALFVSSLPIVSAATITVDSLLDPDPNPVKVTLREAVAMAGNGDTIDINVAGTIDLKSGELLIGGGRTITIQKKSTLVGDVTISSNGVFRVFTVSDGSSLILKTIRLTNGPIRGGGAIDNSGDLRLERVTIFDTVSYGAGGGIYNRSSGEATLLQSAVLASTSLGPGAAVYNEGKLTIANSTFSGNWTPAQGGGVYNTVNGELTILNSTIANNRANQEGGAIYNLNLSTTQVAVKNSIIAYSSDSTNCKNINADDSLQFPGKSCGVDVISAEPYLGPIENLGDFAPVLTLLPNSPAIDSGSSATCASAATVKLFDQHQRNRMVDGNGDGLLFCDMGAYEAPGLPTFTARFVPSSIVPSASTTGVSTRLDFTLHNPTLALTSIAFNAPLPPSFQVAEFQPANPASPDCLLPGTVTANEGATSVQFSGFHVDVGKTCTISVNVVGSEIKTYNYAIEPDAISVVPDIGIVMGEPAIVRVGIYTCDKSGLQLAVSNGGSAIFDCKQPRVLQTDSGAVILTNPVIDGQGGMTLLPGRGGLFFRAAGPQHIQGLTVKSTRTIYVQSGSTLTIENSTFSDSSSLTNGGLIVVRRGGSLNIRSSTFYNNSASGRGGVIYVESGGRVTIDNSTFTGNTSGIGGGAIYSEIGGDVAISRSTFSSNTAPQGSALMLGGGSAIQIRVFNSILNDTCAGGVTGQGSTIQFPGTSCGVAIPVGNPVLDTPLQDNGGSTPTLALGPNSAANGAVADCLAPGLNVPGIDGLPLDQRGFVRPNAACDLGAFESSGSRPNYRVSVTGTDNAGWAKVGENFDLKVEAVTNVGSIVTSYEGTARVSSSITGVTTLPNITIGDTDNGIKQIETSLLIPGLHQITVTDAANTEISRAIPLDVRAYPDVTVKFTPANITGGVTKLVYIISNPNPHLTLTNVRMVHTFPTIFDPFPIPRSLVYVAGVPAIESDCGAIYVPALGGSSVDIRYPQLESGDVCRFEINVAAYRVGDVTTNIDFIASDQTGQLAGSGVTNIADTLHVQYVKPLVRTRFAPDNIFLNGTSTLSLEIYNPNAGDIKISSLATTLTAGIVVAPDPKISVSPNCPGIGLGAITASPGGASIGINAGLNPFVPPYTTCIINVDVKGTTTSPIEITTTSGFVETGANPDVKTKLSISSQACVTTGIQNITWQSNDLSYSRYPRQGNISPDGRYVVFASDANTFAANDASTTDIFVYDRSICRFQRVSVMANGKQSTHPERGPNDMAVISGSASGGPYVAFSSKGRDFTEAPTYPEIPNAYFRSLTTDPILMSNFSPLIPLETPGFYTISADGRYVAFDGKVNDSNNWRDVYIFDKDHPNDPLTRISKLVGVNWHFDQPSFSANGRYLALVTSFSIPQGDCWSCAVRLDRNDNSLKLISKVNGTELPRNGLNPIISSDSNPTKDGDFIVYFSWDSDIVSPAAECPVGAPDCGFIYRYDVDNDVASLVAPVRTGDLVSGYGAGILINASISGDGRFITFTSNLSYLPADTNNIEDVYLYDHLRDEFVIISRGMGNTNANNQSYGASISADGRFVVFGSAATNLVTYDTNPYLDTYVAPNPLHGTSGPTFMAGRFHILKGESNPQFDLAPREIYIVEQADGTQIEVRLPAALEPALFDRQQVTLKGYPDAVDDGVIIIPDAASIQIEPMMMPMAQIPNHNWATLLCRFSDFVGSPPQPLTWAQTLMTGTQVGGVRHYWGEQSYGTLIMAGNQVAGWFTMPQPRSFYLGPDGLLDGDELQVLFTACTSASTGVNFANFGGINLFFDNELDGYAWGSTDKLTLGANQYYVTWIPPWGYQNIAPLVHEMGHSFGLTHTSGSYLSAYDSAWDMMSGPWLNCPPFDATYGCMGVGTIAYNRMLLEWIPLARRAQVNPSPISQTIVLERLSQPVASDTDLIAIVPIGGSVTQFYTVETRMKVGYDVNLPGEGVIIHRIDTTIFDRNAQVIDSDIVGNAVVPNGNPNDAGAIWSVGEVFRDAGSNITIEVLAQGATSFTVRITNGSNAPQAFGKPVLVSPLINATAAPLQAAAFKWNPVAGATSYELQFGNVLTASATIYTSTCAMPATPTSPAACASLSLFMPVEPGLYYWKVRAVSTIGTSVIQKSEWSDLRQLALQSPNTAAPQLNYAIDTARTLSWNRVSWAAGYHVMVDNNPDFSSPEFQDQTLDASRLSLITNELEAGRYYWRVRAKTPNGSWGAWSIVDSFILSTP